MRKPTDLFQNDVRVALNNLLSACRQSVNYYNQTAKLINGDEYLESRRVGDAFERLYDGRERVCEHLKTMIGQGGGEAAEPDSDRRSLKESFSPAKTRTEESEYRALLEEATGLETDIQGHLAVLTGLDLPQDLGRQLKEISNEIRLDQQYLDYLLSTLL